MNFFQTYLTIISKFGILHAKNHEIHNNSLPQKTFEDYDQDAINFANQHRSSGIFIGILGIVIFALAVLPQALDLDEHTVHNLTYAKIFSMTLTIGLIAWYSKRRSKERWIANRIRAEQLRYDWLLKTEEATPEKITTLVNEQIDYNKRKAAQYEKVENATTFLTWLTFSSALVAAWVHLFIDANWLLIFTALIPASIGVLHGINSFLGISTMIRDHEYAEAALHEILQSLNACEKTDRQAIEKIAHHLHWLMATRDIQWLKLAQSMRHIPA